MNNEYANEDAANHRVNNNKTTTSKSLEYNIFVAPWCGGYHYCTISFDYV